MTGNKLMILLLILVAFLLALNLVKELAAPASLLPRAQAQTIDRVYPVSRDTHFITTDSTGQRVYLYYFEHRTDKTSSKLYFITSAEASEKYRYK